MQKQRKYRLSVATVLLTVGLLGACGNTNEPTKPIAVNEMAKPNTENSVYLHENEAFRIQGVDVKEDGKTVTVYGEARVHEANITYSVEDGHAILDEGFTTASVAAPEWGVFEFTTRVKPEEMHTTKDYVIVVYEESMKDGSWQHQLNIPIHLDLPETKND